MSLPDIAGWDGFLKGLGGAGLFIVFLLWENSRLRRDRREAQAGERTAVASLLAAKDAHTSKLLEIMKENRVDAIAATAAHASLGEGQKATAEAMNALAESVDQLVHRRRSA